MKTKIFRSEVVIALALMSFALVGGGAETDEAGFQSLFNGKDLTGWQKDALGWSVTNGAITAASAPRSYLTWSGGIVGDFELRFEFKLVSGMAKVHYRGRKIETTNQANSIKAYTFEMAAPKVRAVETGLLFEDGDTSISSTVPSANRGRRKLSELGKKTVRESTGKDVTVGETETSPNEIRSSIRQDGWNEAGIRAEGNHLVHKLNGHVAVDVMDVQAGKQSIAGTLGLRAVDTNTVIHFRNIRLRKLP